MTLRNCGPSRWLMARRRRRRKLIEGGWEDGVDEAGIRSAMEESEVRDESVEETDVVEETDETEVSEHAEGEDTE